jgi:hypothetical protein
MHANHAIHDVKWGRVKGSEGRKVEDSGGTVYLGVKGSQVQILSSRQKSPWNITGDGNYKSVCHGQTRHPACGSSLSRRRPGAYEADSRRA